MCRFVLMFGVIVLVGRVASAATIGISGSSWSSDLSGPFVFTVPGPNIPIYDYNNVDSGSAVATSISGFASLLGVTPSDLTMSFGDLERLSTTFTPGGCVPVYPSINCATVVSSYGDLDAGPNFFSVSLAGTGTILTGSFLSLVVETDSLASSPGFGTATASGTVHVTGGLAPYLSEVSSLTGGTGVASVSLGSFSSICFPGSDPCEFTYAGAVSFIPEPTTALLLGVGLTGMAAGSRRRRSARVSASL